MIICLSRAVLLTQVMRQLQKRSPFEEAEEDIAAAERARIRGEKAEIVSQIRAELKEAREELAADRDLERKELMIQVGCGGSGLGLWLWLWLG